MKKSLTLVIVIIVVALAWYILHKSTSPSSTIVNTPSASAVLPDPSNATFTIDDATAKLTNGKATIDLGNGITQEADLTDVIAYGDLNNDSKEDAAFFLVTTNAVSGTLNAYVAAYVSGLVSYKTTEAVPVGIQIVPKSVSISGNTVTVTYLDRAPNEPLAAEPTVLTTKTFIFSSVDTSLTESE